MGMLKFSGRGGAEHTIPEVRSPPSFLLSVTACAVPVSEVHPRARPAPALSPICAEPSGAAIASSPQEEKRAFADHVNSNCKARAAPPLLS